MLSIKEKIDELTILNLLPVFLIKSHNEEWKASHKLGEEFASHITDKELVSTICLKTALIIKRSKEKVEECTKDKHRCFIEDIFK